MNLKQIIRISSENDSTTVALNDSGTIYVGAITLTATEADGYGATVAEAIKRVKAANTEPKVDK